MVRWSQSHSKLLCVVFTLETKNCVNCWQGSIHLDYGRNLGHNTDAFNFIVYDNFRQNKNIQCLGKLLLVFFSLTDKAQLLEIAKANAAAMCAKAGVPLPPNLKPAPPPTIEEKVAKKSGGATIEELTEVS